jgi:hypothetical protein
MEQQMEFNFENIWTDKSATGIAVLIVMSNFHTFKLKNL